MPEAHQIPLQLNGQQRTVEVTQLTHAVVYTTPVTFAGDPQRVREEGITASLSTFGIVPGGVEKYLHEANEGDGFGHTFGYSYGYNDSRRLSPAKMAVLNRKGESTLWFGVGDSDQGPLEGRVKVEVLKPLLGLFPSTEQLTTYVTPLLDALVRYVEGPHLQTPM